jgi:hypothetical protein
MIKNNLLTAKIYVLKWIPACAGMTLRRTLCYVGQTKESVKIREIRGYNFLRLNNYFAMPMTVTLPSSLRYEGQAPSSLPPSL